MAFPKMGLLSNLKDLVTKGPTGMANERMKESLAMADEMNRLDRSDPEAMKAYMAKRNVAAYGELNKHFVTRNVVSDENKAHIEQLQNKAMEDQAEFYQMMKEHREKKAREAVGSTAPPSSGELL
ncbi:hypothetical protein [Terriglobus sp.]|uniref:hypothetical protein n=1 Tax=Terriglobus sp. TaxID=1889013 RepID=UPI003B0082A7